MKSKIYIFCFVILSCLILRINNYAWEQKYGLHWHDRVEEIKSVKVMKAEGNFFGSYNEYELVVEFKYIVPDSQSKTGDGLSHETFYLTIKLTYYPNTGEVIERVQEVYYPPGTLSVPFVTGSHKAMSAADPLLYGGPFATTSVEGNIYETRHDGHYEYKVAKMHF